MKYLIMLLLFPITSYAAPFVVSDSTNQQVTHCGWVLDTSAKMDITVAVDSSGGKYCKYDLQPVTKGSHVIKATFVNIDPVWGRNESAFSSALNFTKPDGTIGTFPSGLQIIP